METEKQRERLVELIRNAENDKNLGWYDLYDLCEERNDCAEYFADYLIANNVVVLPLKVGDNVFFLHYGEICEATVVNVEYNYYTNPQEWVTVEYRSETIGTNRYKARIDLMFGKTVFLSRAEAEAKLKERQNGNQSDNLRRKDA